VSIAFASGSDITNSLSDVSLIKNDFTLIKKILELSKMNNRKVKIALTYAFAFNIIVMPIAILSLIQPWMGASMMALSSIMVSLNALLYKKTGQKRLDKI
ncbi:MAG: cation-transporting P-type ATPase, partial [Mycoplasmataceae bacterium]|nr:cation-transporting P-type ATPase [Mycoplasmataceae bacterium]